MKASSKPLIVSKVPHGRFPPSHHTNRSRRLPPISIYYYSLRSSSSLPRPFPPLPVLDSFSCNHPTRKSLSINRHPHRHKYSKPSDAPLDDEFGFPSRQLFPKPKLRIASIVDRTARPTQRKERQTRWRTTRTTTTLMYSRRTPRPLRRGRFTVSCDGPQHNPIRRAESLELISVMHTSRHESKLHHHADQQDFG